MNAYVNWKIPPFCVILSPPSAACTQVDALRRLA